MRGAIAEALWREGLSRIRGLANPPLSLSLSTPERVLVAPPDILAGSARLADALYGGRFELAGHSIETGGASPFAVADAPPEWQRALHGFGWLRHAAVRDDALARMNARALTADWFREFGHPGAGVPWEPVVASARLRHWLSHSPLLIGSVEGDGDDAVGFEDRFLRQLALHRRVMRRMARDARDPLARLHALVAVAIASLALPTRRDEQQRVSSALDAELDAQILPDGGHVSRRADVALDLLAALLPLRECFVARGLVAPPGLLPAIDRMVPALAHHRLGDGSLARHNGTHAARLDRLDAVMALETDERGLRVPSELPDTGYHRLSMGDTMVVVDAAGPPPIAHASAAHAGTLSFEMSVHGVPLVVNLGASEGSDDLARALRSTPAHSTLTLHDASSARIVPPGLARRLFGEAMVEGPTRVDVRRADATDGSFRGLGATHDGYRAQGVLHERVLSLRDNGDALYGEDRLRPMEGGSWTPPPAALRFHLHPEIGVAFDNGGVLLLVGDQQWRFTTDLAVAVEETLFCDGAPVPSQQLVVRLDGGATGANWAFTRDRSADGEGGDGGS